MNTTEIISLNPDNIESEHICCAIGNDNTSQARALQKKEWMKERFEKELQKRMD